MACSEQGDVRVLYITKPMDSDMDEQPRADFRGPHLELIGDCCHDRM